MTAVEIEPENEPDNEPEDSEPPAGQTVESEVEIGENQLEVVEAEVAEAENSVEEPPMELIEPELPPGPKLTKNRPDSVHDTKM